MSNDPSREDLRQSILTRLIPFTLVIAALLYAVAALVVAILLPDTWSLLALPLLALSFWASSGRAQQWFERRQERRQ